MAKLPRGKLILLVLVLSLVLYGAGVLSGLFANQLLEHRVTTNLTLLREYIDSSALDVKNIQLQQLFVEDFQEGSCDFRELYLTHLEAQLSTYWDRLPARLEEFDARNLSSDDYIGLKREYIRHSLRMWLIAANTERDCPGTKFLPILYFYSAACKDCVQQGESFDEFKRVMDARNMTVIVFPIDINYWDDTVYLLVQYYNVTEVPAIVSGQRLFTGLLTATDLERLGAPRRQPASGKG
jgi:hypothetical protein